MNTKSIRSGNKVLRRTHDDAASVGNVLTHQFGGDRLVHNPPPGQLFGDAGPEETANGDRVADVRAGDGFMLLCISADWEIG
jgi:hypothetical protein